MATATYGAPHIFVSASPFVAFLIDEVVLLAQIRPPYLYGAPSLLAYLLLLAFTRTKKEIALWLGVAATFMLLFTISLTRAGNETPMHTQRHKGAQVRA